MNTLFTPFIDVTVNAEWSDWQHYPNGRPNPLYSQEAIEWGVSGLVFGFITLSASGSPAGLRRTPCRWTGRCRWRMT
ncbi:hypothetical protein H3N91_003243 [Salmonella enterica]|nr:hypothetical protein [Salmonella enterica]EGB7058006.1 hypothetical protein [Salmonella enterica]EKL9527188.1 hypothetical protein [Salmonella enterica]